MALDCFSPDRRAALWEVGLRYRPGGYQQPLPVAQDLAPLDAQSRWEVMEGEYRTLGQEVLDSQQVAGLPEGTEVTVAGLVIRRQRPLARAVYMTLEDELGHIPLAVWPREYRRLRLVLREPLLVVRGVISRREGTFNIEVETAWSLEGNHHTPRAKDWG